MGAVSSSLQSAVFSGSRGGQAVRPQSSGPAQSWEAQSDRWNFVGATETSLAAPDQTDGPRGWA